MPALNIEGTESTPEITLDKRIGKFEIMGKSLPEESRSFYSPIFEWITGYIQNPNEETNFEFKMEYYNSSSSLIISEILNLLNKLYEQGNKVTISWSYLEIDDEMLEAGQEYSELIAVPFVYKALREIKF